MSPGNKRQDHGTLRQRDLGTSETAHRQGSHTSELSLQSEIETQNSSQQIQSTLCGEGLQTGGRT